MYPPDFWRLLDLGYWFNGEPGLPTPYTYVVLGLFGVALIGSLVVWTRRRQLFPGQRVKTRLAARLGPWAVGLSATGLASAALRVAEVPILSARVIWLVCGLGLLGIAAYLLWYARVRYPREIVRLEREELIQRYMPRPRRRRSSGRRR